MNNNIRYIDLDFWARSEGEFPENIHPQVAITLRGAFGIAIKNLVCHNSSKECDKCLLRSRCPYMLIFEGLAPENRQQMKLYPYIPQPFVFRLLDDTYISGNTLRFGLRLFGEAVDLYPYVIVAVRNMLLRGLGRARQKFELETVSDGEKDIYSNDSTTITAPVKKFVNISELMGSSESDTDNTMQLHIKSLTPVHIRTDGRWNQKPSLADLGRAALRRIKIMSYFYSDANFGNNDDGDEFTKVLFSDIEQAEVLHSEYDVWSFARYSTRQKRRVPLSGVFLDIAINSPSGRIRKLFDIAGKLNLGKYTSFGMGQIVCEV